MVPGMSERDLMMADLRRAEWLAEAAREQRWVNRAYARPGTRHESRPRAGVVAAALAMVREWRTLRSGSVTAHVHRTATEGR